MENLNCFVSLFNIACVVLRKSKAWYKLCTWTTEVTLVKDKKVIFVSGTKCAVISNS